MTDEELHRLLRGGEGSRVEFKSTCQPHTVRRAVVAFANRLWEPEPGVLFLGVRDDGTIIGVLDPDQTQKDVRKYIDECYPPIENWEVRPLLCDDGKRIVAVIVPESHTAPHFTGGAYVRQGSESPRASAEQFERLLAHRSSAARVLGPWVGREIFVERQVQNARGVFWSQTSTLRRLHSVQMRGLVIDEGGGMMFGADWARVALQPAIPNQPPHVRISL